MRFVLTDIQGDVATLETNVTNKKFTTNVNDLIFINTSHNRQKADRLEKKQKRNNSKFNIISKIYEAKKLAYKEQEVDYKYIDSIVMEYYMKGLNNKETT